VRACTTSRGHLWRRAGASRLAQVVTTQPAPALASAALPTLPTQMPVRCRPRRAKLPNTGVRACAGNAACGLTGAQECAHTHTHRRTCAPLGAHTTDFLACVLRCERNDTVRAVGGVHLRRWRVRVSSRTSVCRPLPPLSTHMHKSTTALLHTAPHTHGRTHAYFSNLICTLRNATDRQIFLRTYSTAEDAARVADFAVLSLRGVDTQTATNFDKGAYLGADGALLPVEAALPWLGRDQHTHLRGKLGAAVVGAGGGSDDGPEGGADSGRISGSDSAGDTAAVGAQPPARSRGPASGGGAASRHGQAFVEARGPRVTRASGLSGSGRDDATGAGTRKRCAADAANAPPAKKGQAAKYRGACLCF
jgi:hypothetical protein